MPETLTATEFFSGFNQNTLFDPTATNRSNLNHSLKILDRLIEQDLSTHLTPIKAFRKEECDYREQVAQEMQGLKQRFSSHDFNPEKSLDILLNKVERDLVCVSQLKSLLQSSELDTPIVKPVRYNRLTDITQATHELIKNHFTSLIDPSIESVFGYDYSYIPNHVTWLGDPEPHAFYGTARATPLKDTYLRLVLHQEKRKYLYEINNILPKWTDRTVLANPHPIPAPLIQHLPGLTDCTYFSTANTLKHHPYALIMPHSYYELGGGRADYDRTWDCSSFIAHHTTGILFTTLDLHIHSITALRHPIHDYYYPNTPIAQSIHRHFQPKHLIDPTQAVITRDPQVDIKPGMVMCTRDIEKNNEEAYQKILGVKGHTAFVVSEPRSDGGLWTGGCDRRLTKNINGLGYAYTSITPTAPKNIQRMTHFFSLK